MKMLLPLALVVSLSMLAGCSRLPSINTTAADELARVERGYATAKAVSEMLMPFLPAESWVKVRMIQRRIEAALRAARAASTAAEQARALATVRQGTVQLDQAAKPLAWVTPAGA